VGSGGSAFMWYAGLLKNEILDQLGTEKQAHGSKFSVSVRVWVRSDGTVDHVRITQSSGDRERDRAIEAAVSRIHLAQGPPADMPEPISLNIASHG
jgi:protein TonB